MEVINFFKKLFEQKAKEADPTSDLEKEMAKELDAIDILSDDPIENALTIDDFKKAKDILDSPNIDDSGIHPARFFPNTESLPNGLPENKPTGSQGSNEELRRPSGMRMDKVLNQISIIFEDSDRLNFVLKKAGINVFIHDPQTDNPLSPEIEEIIERTGPLPYFWDLLQKNPQVQVHPMPRDDYEAISAIRKIFRTMPGYPGERYIQ